MVSRSAIRARCSPAAAHSAPTAPAKRPGTAARPGPAGAGPTRRAPRPVRRVPGCRTRVKQLRHPGRVRRQHGRRRHRRERLAEPVLGQPAGVGHRGRLAARQKSLITLDTSLISRSARLKQAWQRRPGVRDDLVLPTSGSEAQYALSQAAVARATAPARPGSGADRRSIQPHGRRPTGNRQRWSRSSSTVRRASSAAVDAPGRDPLRSRFAARTSSPDAQIGGPGPADPPTPSADAACTAAGTPGSASSARSEVLAGLDNTDVLPGLPSQPSHVGAYRTVVNAPGAGGPAYRPYGRPAAGGRSPSRPCPRRRPPPARTARAPQGRPPTTSSYAFAYGLHEDSLSLSPWLTKACLIVGIAQDLRGLPRVGGCRRTRAWSAPGASAWTPSLRHTTDVGRRDPRCTMNRSRSTITGRPSSARGAPATCWPGRPRTPRPRSTGADGGPVLRQRASNQSSTSCSPAPAGAPAAAAGSAPGPVRPPTGTARGSPHRTPARRWPPSPAARPLARQARRPPAGARDGAAAARARGGPQPQRRGPMFRVTTGQRPGARTRTDTAGDRPVRPGRRRAARRRGGVHRLPVLLAEPAAGPLRDRGPQHVPHRDRPACDLANSDTMPRCQRYSTASATQRTGGRRQAASTWRVRQQRPTPARREGGRQHTEDDSFTAAGGAQSRRRNGRRGANGRNTGIDRATGKTAAGQG